MSVSIKQHFKHSPTQESIELKRVLTAVLNDQAALKNAITGLTAKLDADAGVTDSNYAATLDPGALELTA